MAIEYCVIDPVKRIINIPVSQKTLGAQSDKDSERLYFQCPKFVGDNIDLTKASIYINAQNASGLVSGKDRYEVTDIKEEGDNVTFSWLIPRKIAAYQGTAKFSVCVMVDSEDKEWNTTIAEGEVLEGLELTTPEEREERGQDFLAVLTADADAEEESIEAGKSGYVKGKKVEGKLSNENEFAVTLNNPELATTIINIPGFGQSNLPVIKHTGVIKLKDTSKPVLIKGENTKEFSCTEVASLYGDAKPEDVRAGKTFTSSSGIKKEGTRVENGKVAQGTVKGQGIDDIIIDTGLSNVSVFVLYAKVTTTNQTGLQTLYYDQNGIQALGIKYSSYLSTPSTAHGEVDVSNGTVTYKPKNEMETTNLISDKEYRWIAIK